MASEVVSAGIVSGSNDFTDYSEAQRYLEHAITPSAALKFVLSKSSSEIAAGSTKPNESAMDLLLDSITVDTIELLWDRISRQRVWDRIHQAKKLAVNQLANPISWADAAWHYSVDGQFDKAERCMRIALSIDPNNRFVLRASTALFTHFGDPAQAIHYLRKSARTKFDPWLISAHIAASSIADRFSPFLKEGRAMLSNNQISASNVTELASSIATEEYYAGAVKKSRSYFTQALLQPNENTLAQREWMSLSDKRFPFNPANYQKFVPHPFEANTFECMQREQWEEAVMNSVKWFLDAPYNRISITLCVYLLTSFFEKHEQAIKFCIAGLQIHHNDPVLINNLVYCHAMLGTQDEIADIIKRFKSTDDNDLNASTRVAHLATLGLLLFRDGAVSEGRIKYEEALRLAIKLQDELSGNVALINYAREIVLTNAPDKDVFIKRITKLAATTFDPQVRFFCKRFFEKINENSSVSQ